MLYTSLRTQNRSLQKTPFSLKKRNSFRGTTLIELMLSISIGATLTAVAVPGFSGFIVQMRVDSEISKLSRLLLTARNYSINSGDNVIICPLASSGTCSDKWHEALSVFIDVNGNQKYDALSNEQLITTKAAIKPNDTLLYAKKRTKITFQPTGYLHGLSNGTFRYCPEGYKEKSRGIVVARSGRFYATTDIDNDGIDKTRSNKIIECN